MVSAPSCELKTCVPATCSAWHLAIFRRKLRAAILLLVVGVTPTGSSDAGKFAADATQLPTGCQPESLAKPGTGTGSASSVHNDLYPLEVEFRAFWLHLSAFDFPLIKNQTSF
jgi:hypothetical protein